MNICISGQMRKYSESSGSILDYFSNYDNQVFISTWDEIGGKRIDTDDCDQYNDTRIDLNDIKEKFKTDKILISNRDDFLKKYSEYRDFNLLSYEDRMFSQHYKWYTSILFGAKNNSGDDITVKARPDMIYKNYSKFNAEEVKPNNIIGCEGTTIKNGFTKPYWRKPTPRTCYAPEFDKIKSKIEKYKEYEKIISDFELEDFYELIDIEKIKQTILSFSYDKENMPGICDILLISKTNNSILYSSLLFFIHLIHGFDGFYSKGYCPIKVIFGLINLDVCEISKLSVHNLEEG